MTSDELQQLKAGAEAVRDHGVIQSIHLSATTVLAMIERIEAGAVELEASRKESERNKSLFLAACSDLGRVSEELSLDPDDGGAAPIIDAIKGLRAGVPAGWKAVPIEPTEDMVIDGFESAPDRMFDGPDYPEEYDAMSGCQQAAFRAKRCWAAMLDAAPGAQDAGSAT